MSDTSPDYATVQPPAETPPSEYTCHQRRGEILQVIIEAGTPSAVKQTDLAERYDVHESTISRDMDRLREYAADALGRDAKLTTLSAFEKTVRELQREGEWKKAWDVVMDWNGWLADLGEQHREPRRSELGVDMRSTNVDVAYEIVREGDGDPLPTTDAGDDGEAVDYDDLGFTSAPVSIDVAETGGGEDGHE